MSLHNSKVLLKYNYLLALVFTGKFIIDSWVNDLKKGGFFDQKPPADAVLILLSMIFTLNLVLLPLIVFCAHRFFCVLTNKSEIVLPSISSFESFFAKLSFYFLALLNVLWVLVFLTFSISDISDWVKGVTLALFPRNFYCAVVLFTIAASFKPRKNVNISDSKE